MSQELTPRITDKDGRRLYRVTAIKADGEPWQMTYYAKNRDAAIDLALYEWPGSLDNAQAMLVESCEWRTIYEFDHRKEANHAT